MTNTPNPQANKTVDEIVEELFKMGILAGIGKANIDASGAKRLGSQSIKALITEARIDELEGARLQDWTIQGQYIGDRLKQLKKKI